MLNHVETIERVFTLNSYDVFSLKMVLSRINEAKSIDILDKSKTRFVYVLRMALPAPKPIQFQNDAVIRGVNDVNHFFSSLPSNLNYKVNYEPQTRYLSVRCFYLDHLVIQLINHLNYRGAQNESNYAM